MNAVEHEAQAALFHRQYLIYQQTGKIARKLDIPVKTTVLSENRRHKQKDLAFIEQHLFKFPLQSADYAGGLSLVETANRRLECEAVASDILRLCRDENYRHHEIGILLRAEDEYGNLLEAVLTDYEIPYFSDTKRQSSHHPLAELIRSSLEAVRTWQYEPLFRAFKTDFSLPPARKSTRWKITCCLSASAARPAGYQKMTGSIPATARLTLWCRMKRKNKILKTSIIRAAC